MKLEFDLSELVQFGERLQQQDMGLKRATKELAEMLRLTLKVRTPFRTGALRAGWDQSKGIRVKKVAGGYEVALVNPVEYAAWVNDGHRVKNRKDGPDLLVKNRVKVPSPARWQADTSDWYVFGHFFVETSILSMENNGYVEKIIMENLERWLRWCCG